jgi:acetyl-CoA carboxylase carboxyl transferase subunit beta
VKREEDIEVNLTGEELNHSDAADKSRWFKRIRKGISTSTADKKETPEGLMDVNVQPVTIFVLVLN